MSGLRARQSPRAAAISSRALIDLHQHDIPFGHKIKGAAFAQKVGRHMLRRPGGSSERDTPDPIPNSAVKPLSANGTSSQDAGESVAARSSKHMDPKAFPKPYYVRISPI